MTTRQRGMDHALYAYSPLPTRPRFVWPDGARVASCVVLYLEHWELEPPADAVRDPRFKDIYGTFTPEYRAYTWREYGNRIGVFRVLDLLDRYGLKANVAAGSAVAEFYPALIDACLDRGAEFIAHGNHATRMLTSRMSEAEERDFIAASIDALHRATGTRPEGWAGQDYGESTRTPSLLAEAGLTHVIDWPNDDQPYAMTIGRPFISIPNQSEWDDVQLLWHRRLLTPRYPEIIGEAFETLWEEGAVSGRFFALHLHPWLIGMPHRIRYLDEALRNLAAYDQVWRTTTGEVATHVLEGNATASPPRSR